MVDLETLDTIPNAQILTIGAVKFDPNSLVTPYNEFYYRLELDDQTEKGRSISDSTMEWWGKQSAEAINESFGEHNRHAVIDMLSAFKKWYVGCDEIWAQGINFDISMLEHLHHQYDCPVPWAHWKVECSKTWLRIPPTDFRKQFDFTAHNALEDAKAQAKAVQLARKWVYDRA